MISLVLLVVVCLSLLLCVNSAKLELIDYMISGAIATTTTDLVLYPIDTVKVTQQSSKQPLSFRDAFKSIAKGGFSNFFNGALGYATLDGCSAAIFFAVYEEMKIIMSMKLSGAALGLSAYPSAAAAFVASSIFLVPAELVKTRMQTSDYGSVWNCLNECTKAGGLKGLYAGYAAILVRDLPYFSLQLGCYDNIKNILSAFAVSAVMKKLPFKLGSGQVELLSSIAAGIITGFCTNPMDVVTARLLTQTEAQVSTSVATGGTSTKALLQGHSHHHPTYSHTYHTHTTTTTTTTTTPTTTTTTTTPTPEENVDKNHKTSSSSTNNKSDSKNKKKTTKDTKGSKEETNKNVLEEDNESIVDVPYNGLWDCVIRMNREEGPQVFFLGAAARVGWIAPFTAISLGINEMMKRTLLNAKLNPSTTTKGFFSLKPFLMRLPKFRKLN